MSVPPDASSQSIRVDELLAIQEEIELQTIIIASIEEATDCDNPEQAIQTARDEIKRLKRQFHDLENAIADSEQNSGALQPLQTPKLVSSSSSQSLRDMGSRPSGQITFADMPPDLDRNPYSTRKTIDLTTSDHTPSADIGMSSKVLVNGMPQLNAMSANLGQSSNPFSDRNGSKMNTSAVSQVNQDSSSTPLTSDGYSSLSASASSSTMNSNTGFIRPLMPDLPSRKRSRSNQRDSFLGACNNNKSRRTSQTSNGTSWGTPIFLSSEDEDFEDFEDFDTKVSLNAEQAAKSKAEQEKADAAYASKLQAEFDSSYKVSSSKSGFAIYSTSQDSPNPFGNLASSSTKLPWKPESSIHGSSPRGSARNVSTLKLESSPSLNMTSPNRKLPGKTEPSSRPTTHLQGHGSPHPGSSPPMQIFGSFMADSYDDDDDDDDSDVEIIDSSIFRDNDRQSSGNGMSSKEINRTPQKREADLSPNIFASSNSTGQAESSNALQMAMYGKGRIPSWLSPAKEPSTSQDKSSPNRASFYAGMSGAFPSGNSHNLALDLGSGPDHRINRSYSSDDTDENIHQARNMDGVNENNTLGDGLDFKMQRRDSNIVNTPHKTDEEIKNLLANIRPDEDLPKENREDTPEGMAYPLYEHQKLALTWLKAMEVGTNKGGILADDMGLGKTISALALIVSRPSEDPARKTTLIVAPVALVRQWEREIKMKLKPGSRLSTLNLHGAKRKTWDGIRLHDVVLTTYNTLAAEFKRVEKYEFKKKLDLDELDLHEMKKLFPLFSPRSWFHRVILDEAQCIKNKLTVTARACSNLKSTYRLCLTGTPMMNNVGELYSLIRFLRIRPYNEYTRFQESIGVLTNRDRSDHNREKAWQRLQALLKAILLRRVKTSLIDGKPIINLPPKTENIQHVVFDDDEKAFYEALQSRTQLQFNKYLRAGTVGKNYTNVLVLLLRLRQACCHPHLIRDFETAPKGSDDDEMLGLAKSLGPDVVSRILQANGSFECPICYDGVENPSILIPCGHDSCPECLARISDQAAQDNRANDNNALTKCPSCRGDIDMRKVIDFATFKKVHQPNDVETASEDLDTDSDSDSESLEADEFDVDSEGDLRDFIVPDDIEDTEDEQGLDDEDEMASAVPESKLGRVEDDKNTKRSKRKRMSDKKGKTKEKTRKKEHFSLAKLKTEAAKSAKGRRKYMRHLRKNFQPSAKLSKCVDLLQQFQDDGQKTLVFSQFVSLLDLLQVPIEEKGWAFERYDGGMSADARNDAIFRFTDKPNIKIMLISLKAGNSGINLIAASRVVILDPFWNPFTEMQAIDRAYRIGQQNPVEVHRILVQGTVEDRIMTMQEQKKKMVDTALDEDASKSLSKLGQFELGFLFGI